MSNAQSETDRFRTLVMADPALQMVLARCQDGDTFVSAAGNIAAKNGIALSGVLLRAELRPDPLGLSLLDPAPLAGSTWPGREWLPIQLSGPAVDWAHFAGAPLDAPFFAGASRRAASLPFNRLFRYRTGLDDFVADAELEESLRPDGLIFHMSRCGSTLLSQMVAALPGMVAISEARPLDEATELAKAMTDEARQDALVRAMVAALGRRRAGARHLVLKLNFRQAMKLPLFRRAFPTVPWIFLYRDPVEVMASQMDEPGPETDPSLTPPSVYGIDGATVGAREDYVARVLGQVCGAAADAMAGGGGLALHYRDLPGAIPAILDHFEIPADAAGQAAMTEVARWNAKAPAQAFAGDSAGKQKGAGERLRAAAELHVGEAYGRLEAMRWTPGQ